MTVSTAAAQLQTPTEPQMHLAELEGTYNIPAHRCGAWWGSKMMPEGRVGPEALPSSELIIPTAVGRACVF